VDYLFRSLRMARSSQSELTWSGRPPGPAAIQANYHAEQARCESSHAGTKRNRLYTAV